MFWFITRWVTNPHPFNNINYHVNTQFWREMGWCVTRWVWTDLKDLPAPFIDCEIVNLLFQFHHQRSVAMKYAMQSQLICKLTVIVFKAEANKRHFSQHSDLLIMNSKLPSLLFIKWPVTADERLALKVNGICHRASKEREHVKI